MTERVTGRQICPKAPSKGMKHDAQRVECEMIVYCCRYCGADMSD